MTEGKITLDEVCEAWRHAQRRESAAHLASSVLFDLIHQSLDDAEGRQAFQHLVECTACLQQLKAMMNVRGMVPTAERRVP
jgi:hypothetical protein